MRKQIILLCSIVLLIIGGLSGCNQLGNSLNPEKNKFVGTWINSQTTVYPLSNKSFTYTFTISFFSDGTCSLNGASGTWDIKDGKLVIDTNANGYPQSSVYSYLFSENNTTLTLIDSSGNETLYTKQ